MFEDEKIALRCWGRTVTLQSRCTQTAPPSYSSENQRVFSRMGLDGGNCNQRSTSINLQGYEFAVINLSLSCAIFLFLNDFEVIFFSVPDIAFFPLSLSLSLFF